MKTLYLLAIALILCAFSPTFGREARLVRYPHYHAGRVAFSYLGDIWTADENGQNIQRLTVNKARDVYPRFSPDGRWIAFSSDRDGNLDVFIIPSGGGTVKQLTFHSADDIVLGWTPDSRAVLFSSNRGDDFMPKLYTVSVDGGMEQSAGPDMGVQASYSPDGQRLALNRRSQVYWRKYYRGAYQSDVTVMDIASKRFTDLTDFDGMDSWPMWGRNGFIYFVSDREGEGLTNIWRVPENGGRAERVTSFKSGDVRWPAISADGRVIVFEHDFGISKLDVASRKVTPIHLDIAAETQESMSEVRDFNSQADDYDLAPTARRVAFSVHGEIFTAPVEEGDMRQITDGPSRDKSPLYSPDGKMIAFISDRSGREELYIAPADGAGEPRKITDLDALKFAFAWSRDSRQIAFTSSDYTLRKYSLATKQTTALASSRYGSISQPVWSPDSKWIAYAKPNQARTTHVYLVPAGGGQERQVTFESYNNFGPWFAPNGRKLYFVRSEGFFGSGITPSVQLYSIALERQERDPDDPEERAEQEAAQAAEQPGADAAARRSPASQRNEPPKEIKIDWPGLKRRTRQVTRVPFPVLHYTISPDSRTIVFATVESSGTGSTPAIYSIQEDGKRLARLAGGAPPPADAPQNPAEANAGGISSLNISRDGRTLFFMEGNGIHSIPMPPPAGATAGGGPALAPAVVPVGTRRRIAFTARVKIDHPAEWAQMFDDA